MLNSFTDRLSTASREELIAHVLLQRDLIQRLHARVLDLEACLAEQEPCADRDEEALYAHQHQPSSSLHHAHTHSAKSPLPQPDRDYNPPPHLSAYQTRVSEPEGSGSVRKAEDRLAEINTVLAAHAAGKPRLPPAMVRQLLLIREDLKGPLSSTTGRRPLSEAGPVSRLVQPQWVGRASPDAMNLAPSAPLTSSLGSNNETNRREPMDGIPTLGSRFEGTDMTNEEPYFDESAPAYLAQQFLSAWGINARERR